MTEEEQANVALIRAICARWHDTRGDPQVWLDAVVDNVHFWSAGQGVKGAEFSAERHGKAEVAEYLNQLVAAFEMEFFRLERTIAQDDSVVSTGSTAWHHRGTGKRLETAIVHVARLAGGRIVAMEEYYDTAAVIRAATPD